MNWFPLCNFTHYSLLRGFSKPAQLVKKCVDNKYNACGIADYKSIAGAVSFYKICKENDIKPIIGCSFDGFTLFAKNKDGWMDLVRIISSMDEEKNVDSTVLQDSCSKNNLISIATDEANSPIKGDDFYVKGPCFYDTYYANQSDAELQRITLCSGMKTTLPKIKSKMRQGTVENQQFFDFDTFYLKDGVEISEVLLQDDSGIEHFTKIYEKCLDYEILHKPILPDFYPPNGQTQEEFLKQICRDGWTKLLIGGDKLSTPEVKQQYLDRFTLEFQTIKEADLFGYFLIVHDILNFVRSKGWFCGPGRGSAAGCLISYLMNITQIDPIEFDLLFERFYNSGRNTADYVSLPDIDMDVPSEKRDEIIHYLKGKYGKDNVGQMLTFGKLQGKSAIKEVLRISEACGFGEMNEMTKSIPYTEEISDQLQAMDEEDRSVIMWALVNNADRLRDFCYIGNDGELGGTYAQYFKQAIEIEGTFKSQSKHAAGVVISTKSLYEVCPMVSQAGGGDKVAGFEMNDLDAIGLPKFDLLGLNTLDKTMQIEAMANS